MNKTTRYVFSYLSPKHPGDQNMIKNDCDAVAAVEIAKGILPDAVDEVYIYEQKYDPVTTASGTYEGWTTTHGRRVTKDDDGVWAEF